MNEKLKSLLESAIFEIIEEEKKKKRKNRVKGDNDFDGDADFADIMIKRMTSSGMNLRRAIGKTRKYNEEP
jgi:hypothetical protein